MQRRRSARIGRTLFAAFLIVPVAELYVLIRVGSVIGGWWTIAMLVTISVVGSWLIKREGIRCFARVRTQLQSHRLPTDDLIDSALILFAGVLMLTPGFLTDALGIVLLLPPLRARVRRQLKHRYGARISFINVDE